MTHGRRAKPALAIGGGPCREGLLASNGVDEVYSFHFPINCSFITVSLRKRVGLRLSVMEKALVVRRAVRASKMIPFTAERFEKAVSKETEMNRNMFHVVMVLTLALFSPFFSVTELSAVVIEYKKDGEIHKVEGQPVEKGIYLFKRGPEKIRLATLEWPPYVSEAACGQGWVQQLVVGVFLSEGYTVEVGFFPWKRALHLVERGEWDALYPEYDIPADSLSDVLDGVRRLEFLSLSDGFPGGSLVFFRRKGADITFNGDFEALKGLSIGVVSGYENSAELDRMIANRELKVQTANDDWTNIRMLYHGRIDLIVGDDLVIQRTIDRMVPREKQKEYRGIIEPINPIIEEKTLFLAFSQKREGFQQRLYAFNRGLKAYNDIGEVARIRDAYMKCR